MAVNPRKRTPKKARAPKLTSGDLAELVRDKTLADVKAGKLKPTLQHGLMAQQMLDKRNERAADRQLALRMAAMMTGSPVPEGIIVIKDVTPGLLGVGRDDDDGFDPDDADAI
jgi:hypothetical protein